MSVPTNRLTCSVTSYIFSGSIYRGTGGGDDRFCTSSGWLDPATGSFPGSNVNACSETVIVALPSAWCICVEIQQHRLSTLLRPQA